MAKDWDSLTDALEGWFKKSFHDLPNPLRRRVIYDFKPFSWNDLHSDQRRSLARQIDYQRDPATEGHREYWFDFYAHLNDLRRQIAKWECVNAPTASDLGKKESRLAQLKLELSWRVTLEKLLSKRNFPQYSSNSRSRPLSIPQGQLVGLGKALDILNQRLETSAEEISAWVFLSELNGGLRCYREAGNANEYGRYYFETEMGEDYTAELSIGLFDVEELQAFQPNERFITGKALIELWQQSDRENPKATIETLVRSGKLTDLHPIKGATKASTIEGSDLPELESGLFSLSEIEKIQQAGNIVLTPKEEPDQPEKETPSERKSRLHLWFNKEESIKKRGALTRTAKREGITRQALSQILDRASD